MATFSLLWLVWHVVSDPLPIFNAYFSNSSSAFVRTGPWRTMVQECHVFSTHSLCLYHGRVFSLLPCKTSRTWMVLVVAVTVDTCTSTRSWISECSHPERYVLRFKKCLCHTDSRDLSATGRFADSKRNWSLGEEYSTIPEIEHMGWECFYIWPIFVILSTFKHIKSVFWIKSVA